MRPFLPTRLRSLIEITIIALCALALAGCKTVGPSTSADGSGARTAFYPGSNLYLSADGDWSGSSPQNAQQSGAYMTDGEQSAIMPGNASGVRASNQNFGILTGGDVSAATFDLLFKPIPGATEDEALVGVFLESVKITELRIESANFYDMITASLPFFEVVAIALGDDATEQKIAQLEALKASLPDWNELARDAIDALINSLIPIPSLPTPAPADDPE